MSEFFRFPAGHCRCREGDLQGAAGVAPRRTFLRVRALYGQRRDDGGAGANSIEGLGRIRAQRAIADDDPAPWCTWGSAEWAYEAAEASPFNAICGRLADEVLSPRFVQSRFAAFSRQLQTDMIEALRLLDREGLFGTGEDRAAITLFVSISDDDAAEALENASAKALNPPAVADAFLRRYG